MPFFNSFLPVPLGGVPLGYFACVVRGFPPSPYDCYDQQSVEMPGEEEDKNGLYGGNSSVGDCVSHMQPGDEVES